jgi:hypothetical protein
MRWVVMVVFLVLAAASWSCEYCPPCDRHWPAGAGLYCTADTQCSGAWRCLPAVGSDRICTAACQKDADCPAASEGASCVLDGSGSGHCSYPPCQCG